MAIPTDPPMRVRFAPAPTGFLHVGGTRTALFNWLFARHHGATFVLRIEDTDRDRTREEWVDGIQATLRWLGLDWDEGPYRQGDRLQRYLDAADQLLASGAAYESWLTEAELDVERTAAKADGGVPRFYERAMEVGRGGPGDDRTRSVWFRTPTEGTAEFDDVVRGHVAVAWDTIADFMIVRSSGHPVFYLANAVDDAEMGITHVIRGEDLLDSTHRVLALRAALGHPGRPVYAHLPLLVGKDRAKLSKRHGAVAVEDFRDAGYLPEALVNYLSLLGFPAPAEGSEVRPLAEIVADFDLGRVNHSAAFFDHDKLDWMNGEYLRALPVDELVARAGAWCLAAAARGDEAAAAVDPSAPEFAALLAVAQKRLVTLAEVPGFVAYHFCDEASFTIADESWDVLAATELVADVLDAVIAHVERCEWTVEALSLQPVIAALGLKPRNVMGALYAAVEGRHSGLPLFDAIHALGRERALGRLRSARARLE
jgi:glutamyl-tRNA synthetase